MTKALLTAATLVACTTSRGAPAELPQPPSVAPHPAPKAPGEKVRVLIDTIPARALYVSDANAPLQGAVIRPGEERAIGQALSHGVDQLAGLARQAGANTVVLLSSGRGSAIPIVQSPEPLLLLPEAPRLAAILFDWPSDARLTEAERRIRFVIDEGPPGKDSLGERIEMQVNTADLPLASWTYGNISRFVNDALAHDFDTISFRSSSDAQTEEVWLPRCDRPLKLARTKPVLEVTLFKRPAAGRPAGEK
jgi:hypothetical protein